jgi:hypothetical protein
MCMSSEGEQAVVLLGRFDRPARPVMPYITVRAPHRPRFVIWGTRGGLGGLRVKIARCIQWKERLLEDPSAIVPPQAAVLAIESVFTFSHTLGSCRQLVRSHLRRPGHDMDWPRGSGCTALSQGKAMRAPDPSIAKQQG